MFVFVFTYFIFRSSKKIGRLSWSCKPNSKSQQPISPSAISYHPTSLWVCVVLLLCSAGRPLQLNALDLWVLTRSVCWWSSGSMRQCGRRIRRYIVGVDLFFQEFLHILHFVMVNNTMSMYLFCCLFVCQILFLLLFVFAVVVLPRFWCWSKECFVLITNTMLFCTVGGDYHCCRQCFCRSVVAHDSVAVVFAFARGVTATALILRSHVVCWWGWCTLHHHFLICSTFHDRSLCFLIFIWLSPTQNLAHRKVSRPARVLRVCVSLCYVAVLRYRYRVCLASFVEYVPTTVSGVPESM